MKWSPLSEAELIGLINDAEERMSIQQRRVWDAIRVPFTKWKQTPYGDLGGGFWAVAALGQTVCWYNDIEEGFNWSDFEAWGTIGKYWCNQDELEWAVQDALNRITDGYSNRGKFGPPEPI